MGRENIKRNPNPVIAQFEPAYSGNRRPDLKAVFDALSDLGSADGCDPDWRAEVMEKALPEDIEKVRSEFREGRIEAEIARRLDIRPR